MTETFEKSVLELSFIDQKTVITGSKILRPLKIFPLRKGKAAQVFLSNYGGGFVEGDYISIEIDCAENTTSVFTTQANTRIYKSENAKFSKQHLKAVLHKNALCIYLGDPVVPHKMSRFEQKFEWSLANNAVLLMVDWFEAGRIFNNEIFEFDMFNTELKIKIDGKLYVWDKFKINPSKSDLGSPAAFADHTGYMNIFLAGDFNIKNVTLIESHLQNLTMKYFNYDASLEMNTAAMVGSSIRLNEQVYMIRCSSKNNALIRSFVKDLSLALAEEHLLDFNPLEGRI